jgi:hypothetical protein
MKFEDEVVWTALWKGGGKLKYIVTGRLFEGIVE